MDVRLDAPGHVKVQVFNIAGQAVITLLNETRPAGMFVLQWAGRNAGGDILGNGVYLVLIETPAGRMVRKVIILK